MPSGRTNNFPESGRGLGHVTPIIFGRTVGYPSDSLASCYFYFCFYSLHSCLHAVRLSLLFYRAMHFSAKCGIAIACRLSVSPSVCLSVTLVDCDHISWNSSKIISPLVSLGCSLFATLTGRVCSKGNTPKFGPKVTHPC